MKTQIMAGVAWCLFGIFIGILCVVLSDFRIERSPTKIYQETELESGLYNDLQKQLDKIDKALIYNSYLLGYNQAKLGLKPDTSFINQFKFSK